MHLATPNKTELLQRLSDIEQRVCAGGGTNDPSSAKAAIAELSGLFSEVCAVAGVPIEKAQESPPWFPPQPPTKAYYLQYARVFLSIISLADITGPTKVVSEACKTAFEALKGVIVFLRAALE